MGNTTSSRRNDQLKYAAELTFTLATFVSAAYCVYTISDTLSNFTSQESQSFALEKKELARKLKRPELESLEFSKHEISIALDVICPDDLKTSFADVGGMESEIEIIMDNVILPFKFWKEENQQQQLQQQQLLQQSGGRDNSTCVTTSGGEKIECHVPGGMLMYGKPGTGKSMLAKAIAKEAGASFIGVKSGTILDKYVGESDKLVTAIFSLAQKIAPTVIFIDEVDTLLKKREALQSGSASSIGSMLGTLMAEWDGLNSDGKAPVIVLGATNRPMDIDSAFLRRMPLTVQTRAPDYRSRIDILSKMLQKEELSDDVNIDLIAASIEGFTGSDIREICRLASISRMKDILKAKKNASFIDARGTEREGIERQTEVESRRPLQQVDFDRAITKAIKDGQRQTEYSEELSFEESSDQLDVAKRWIQAAMARKQQEMNNAANSGGNNGAPDGSNIGGNSNFI